MWSRGDKIALEPRKVKDLSDREIQEEILKLLLEKRLHRIPRGNLFDKARNYLKKDRKVDIEKHIQTFMLMDPTTWNIPQIFDNDAIKTVSRSMETVLVKDEHTASGGTGGLITIRPVSTGIVWELIAMDAYHDDGQARVLILSITDGTNTVQMQQPNVTHVTKQSIFPFSVVYSEGQGMIQKLWISYTNYMTVAMASLANTKKLTINYLYRVVR